MPRTRAHRSRVGARGRRVVSCTIPRIILLRLYSTKTRKSDLAEDAVELEGIQGTIHGLQAWVDSLHAQQELNRRERSIAQHARRRWINRGKKIESRPELEAEMLLEGLSAWMRGWKDVEEEFQIRARARRTRREQRQALMTGEETSQRLSRQDILSKPLDETDAGLWSRAFPAQAARSDRIP